MNNWSDLFFNKYYYYFDLLRNDSELECSAIHTLLGDSISKIADFCCGYGRITFPLSKLNKSVSIIGFDKSITLITEAIKKINDIHRTDFYSNDLLQNNIDSFTFQGGYLWGTSFGYYEDLDNQNLLRNISSLIQDDGIFLFHQVNQPKNFDHYEKKNGIEFIKKSTVKNGIYSGYYLYVLSNGQKYTCPFKIKLYSYENLVLLFKNVGFRVESVFGDFFLTEYNNASPELIIKFSKK